MQLGYPEGFWENLQGKTCAHYVSIIGEFFRNLIGWAKFTPNDCSKIMNTVHIITLAWNVFANYLYITENQKSL